MKKVLYTLNIALLIVGVGYPIGVVAVEKQWLGLVNTDWSNSGNWQGGTVPGVAVNDVCSLVGSNDFVGVNTTTDLVNPVTVGIGDGAELVIGGHLRNVADIYLGESTGGGGHIDVGAILGVNGTIQVGTVNGASDSSIRIRAGRLSANELDIVKGEVLIQGLWPNYLKPKYVNVGNDGRLKFICLQDGVSLLDITSTLTIASDAKLIVDVSDYRDHITSGTMIIDLVEFGSRSGSFDPAHIEIIGLNGGTISYTSTRMRLTLNAVPVVPPNSDVWDLSDYTQYENGYTFPTNDYPTETDTENYPEFSWDTVPRWISFHDKATASTDEEVADIATFPLIMMEKSNQQGTPTTEQGTLEMAARLKAINPACKILFYFNSDIGWSGYAADAEFNQNEFDWAKLTTDTNGNTIVKTVYGMPWFKQSNPEMRDWWNRTIQGMLASSLIDGSLIDRVVTGYYGRNIIDGVASTPYIDMMYDLYKDQPTGKYMVGNISSVNKTGGTRQNLSFMDGGYYEGWGESTDPEFLGILIQQVRESSSQGKISMLRAGNNYDTQETLAEGVTWPLALYLIAAGPNTYFAYQNRIGGHFDQWKWDTSWIEEFQKPLGEPLGDPIKNGYIYTRSFEYVDVWINLETHEAELTWYDKALLDQHQDVGAPGTEGDTIFMRDGDYKLLGGGAGIQGTSDHFHYAMTDFYDDGEMVVRVDAVENIDPFSMGGLMFRESVDGDAKMVMIGCTQTNLITMKWRDSIGENMATVWPMVEGASVKWVKLVRAGDLFTGYYSLNGYEWLVVDQVTVNMGRNIKAGLAATSWNDSALSEVNFSQFELLESLEMIAYWALDEGGGIIASDSSGNGFDGTIVADDWVQGIHGGALDFNGSSSQVVLPAAAFDGIENKITIAMWVYGDTTQPRVDSVFYAVDAATNRVLNIHLPVHNSIVYWDAGYTTTYDRIYKTAVPSEFMGAWNHWVFTKNATVGEMNIYLNGQLWHSDTGKTRPIIGITEATLGSQISSAYYDGMIDDVRLYDQALNAVEIALLYADSAYTSIGTPIHWLNSYGVVSNGNYEVADLEDFEDDGSLNWQEYIAGTDPTIPDRFGIADFSAGTSKQLEWNAMSNRMYDVYWSSNMLDGFSLIESNLVEGMYVDTVRTNEPTGFYKITVELEQ